MKSKGGEAKQINVIQRLFIFLRQQTLLSDLQKMSIMLSKVLSLAQLFVMSYIQMTTESSDRIPLGTPKLTKDGQSNAAANR